MSLFKFKVNRSFDGITIQNFLLEKMKSKINISGRALKNMINRKGVMINGKLERISSKKVFTADTVTVKIDSADFSTGKKLVIDRKSFLYSDENLLAVDKPDGYPSTPVPRKIPSVSEELKKFLQKDDNNFSAPLHRLDIDTSGVLLFARNKKAENFFLKEFRLRKVEKEYLALIKGRINPDEGVIDQPLSIKKKGSGFEIWQISKYGKAAETHYQTIFTTKNYSLLKVIPKTGRPHQIRVHLSSLGFPILGDNLYGSQVNDSLLKRTMLHAYSVNISLPEGGSILIRADLPEDFRRLLKKFGMPCNPE